MDHALADLSHELWLIHQLCAERVIDRSLRRAAAVQINLIVPILFHQFGRRRDFDRVVSTDLADNRVLVWCELKQPRFVDYGVLVQHLRI